MRNTQSGKLRRVRNGFVMALVVAVTAITGGPAAAQQIAMGTAEPTAAMKCHVVGTENLYPWKKWQCNHCFSFGSLGTYCTGAYLVMAKSNPAGD